MMSMPFIFSWDVICAPLDEAEVEYYQTLEQEHFGDYFNIKVRVRHELCCFTRPQRPPSVIPFDWFSSHMFLPCQEFLENGPSYMQMYFPNPIIPPELIHTMMPDVITYAKAVAQNCRSGFHYETPHFRLFTLVLDVFVQKLYDERDNDIIDMIMRGSMREAQLVPTSKTAIESLKKVKLEDGATMGRCNICLTEFDDGMEVLSMPCKHVFHQECLLQWLKTSHMCPLCRYPMPTSMSD